MHASGAFDVKVSPQATDEKPGGSTLGRMSLDKQFHGDLEGTSKGEMLTAGTSAVKDSAGYVAIERVTGTLKGRSGTFVLQHSGTMTRGAPHLTITVCRIPDRSARGLRAVTLRSPTASTCTSSTTRCPCTSAGDRPDSES